ncbi:MAG: 4'-phosphopantetheinyl transferase superfamily protein [Desulfosarcinaceae bacterium]|jgi:4'-phosphopantetheinyl transferase
MSLYPVILSVPPDIQAAKGGAKVQALSRLARQAAQASARRTLGRHLPDFPKDGDGVPQPVAGVYWSLSHKSALVAGIVAHDPIGIDVEYRRPVKDGMHARIATPEEWRLDKARGADPAQTPPEALFYRFWTAKEAVLKAVGQGLVGLSKCRITALPAPQCMHLTYDGRPWGVSQRWYGDHLVAVALPGSLPKKGALRWPDSAFVDVNIT